MAEASVHPRARGSTATCWGMRRPATVHPRASVETSGHGSILGRHSRYIHATHGNDAGRSAHCGYDVGTSTRVERLGSDAAGDRQQHPLGVATRTSPECTASRTPSVYPLRWTARVPRVAEDVMGSKPFFVLSGASTHVVIGKKALDWVEGTQPAHPRTRGNDWYTRKGGGRCLGTSTHAWDVGQIRPADLAHARERRMASSRSKCRPPAHPRTHGNGSCTRGNNGRLHLRDEQRPARHIHARVGTTGTSLRRDHDATRNIHACVGMTRSC